MTTINMNMILSMPSMLTGTMISRLGGTLPLEELIQHHIDEPSDNY